jgi:hypothetical protein
MKFKYLSISVFILVVMCVSVFGQAVSETAQVGKVAKYDELLAKVQGGDTKIDYKALRMAYSQTKDASPYGSDRDTRSAMNKALADKKYKDAIKSADQILKEDYTNPFAHLANAIAYRELNDTAKADYHKAVYLGLVNSIIAGADGKTPTTAFTVISTEEEYSVMQAFGYPVGGQSLVNKDGHTYDVLHGTDPKTSEKVDVYFNIDIVWAMETKMFSPKN